MPEQPRVLPNIYIEASGVPERYISKSGGRTPAPPERQRQEHAATLLGALNAALRQVYGVRADHAVQGPESSGFILEFRLPTGAEKFLEKLEDRRQHIELLSVADRGPEGLVASVYVPTRAERHFVKKIERYRDEETQRGRPKNEALVARLDAVALGAFESVYTDDLELLLRGEDAVWWEVWLRKGELPRFEHAAEHLRIRISRESIRDGITRRDYVHAGVPGLRRV